MIYSVNLIWIIITNQVPAIKAIHFAPIMDNSGSLNLNTASLEPMLLLNTNSLTNTVTAMGFEPTPSET